MTLKAQAVRVADCPNEISIVFNEVTLFSNQKIWEKNQDRLLNESEFEYLSKLREAISQATYEDFQEVKVEYKANLTDRSGLCVYAPKDGKVTWGAEETRLYTRHGRNILRVSIPVKFRGEGESTEPVWTYLNVEKYSKNGIQLEPMRGAAILGYVDHGAPRFQLGWFSSIEAK